MFICLGDYSLPNVFLVDGGNVSLLQYLTYFHWCGVIVLSICKLIKRPVFHICTWIKHFAGWRALIPHRGRQNRSVVCSRLEQVIMPSMSYLLCVESHFAMSSGCYSIWLVWFASSGFNSAGLCWSECYLNVKRHCGSEAVLVEVVLVMVLVLADR